MTTPFCKMCYDAGKLEEVYTSHWLRSSKDASSRITCPLLLSIKCKFCKKGGHTVKYCNKLKNRQQKQQQTWMVEPYHAIPDHMLCDHIAMNDNTHPITTSSTQLPHRTKYWYDSVTPTKIAPNNQSSPCYVTQTPQPHYWTLYTPTHYAEDVESGVHVPGEQLCECN